jgi:hypothetical protein
MEQIRSTYSKEVQLQQQEEEEEGAGARAEQWQQLKPP